MIGNTSTEIIKEILAEAKALNKVGDSVDRIIVEGKYGLCIELEADFDKEEYYQITVSRIVNNCAVRINDEMFGTSSGDQSIIDACEWAFKVISEFEKKPWLTDEELLAEADFIMNVLDPK